ncbi:hypothetical protein PIB30_085461 [Stylosanthes scabra]|uniref:Secreted protein n=1 Tax=Stylosanthes scabra TaxID=79078 RepID=A0ABU6WTU7_9FABA|nr:hypothetical protein [Stylosanthes scabra]
MVLAFISRLKIGKTMLLLLLVLLFTTRNTEDTGGFTAGFLISWIRMIPVDFPSKKSPAPIRTHFLNLFSKAASHAKSATAAPFPFRTVVDGSVHGGRHRIWSLPFSSVEKPQLSVVLAGSRSPPSLRLRLTVSPPFSCRGPLLRDHRILWGKKSAGKNGGKTGSSANLPGKKSAGKSYGK